MNGKVASSFFKLLLALIFTGVAIFAITRYWLKEYLPKEGSTLVSVDNEVKLGKLLAENIIEANDNQVFNDATTDSALWAISSRLLQNLEPTQYDYQFKVLNDEEINAFTIPGGRIYILKGLLAFAETPEEVAAVLAHEIGHAEKRHVVDKLAKEFGLTLLFSVIAGGDAVMIADLAQTVLSSAFDRKQEEEADDFALELLEKSGISPRALATFFRKMNRENLDYNENLEMVMSHPHNNARIQKALRYETKDDFVEIPFELDWNKIQQTLH